MNGKIVAMITLATFLSPAAAVPSAIMGMVAYDAWGDVRYALMSMVAVFVPCLITLARWAVGFTAYMQKELGASDGEWVTVGSDASKRPIKLNMAKVKMMGEDDIAATKELLRLEYERKLKEIGE